eukprot:4381155-Pyramimonas_sp.AAC.1
MWFPTRSEAKQTRMWSERGQLFPRQDTETKTVPLRHKRYEAYLPSVLELCHIGALRDQRHKTFAPAKRCKLLPIGQALKEVANAAHARPREQPQHLKRHIILRRGSLLLQTR